MATKAQLFRYLDERTRPKRKRAPRQPKPERSPGRASKNEHTGPKGDRKATVVVEEHSGRPSRKSTRSSSNSQRSAPMLERVRQMKGAIPAVRHGRKGV